MTNGPTATPLSGGTPRSAGSKGHTATRDELAALWAEVLGTRPEPGDTFTALGGGSLAVEEVLARSRQALVRALEPADFRDDPTLDEQAARLLDRHRREFRAGGAAHRLLRPGATPALFCFAGAGASVAWFLPLTSALRAGVAVHGLQAHGLQGRALASWTVPGAARRHLRTVTAVQPEGPYMLLGHSFGGAVALHTAHLLRRAGHRVARVILLDTVIDAEVALARWSPQQEGFSAEQAASSRLPRPLRLAADLARACGAGLRRHDPARQRKLFWELGMRAQRRYRIRDTPAVTVLLTRDAPGQAELWRERLPGAEIVAVPGGHLSMIAEPAVHVAIDAALAEVGRTPV
ncbi:alpha/beta fold hydrolase [Nocardia sp. NPDC050697]|uniref:alpha/beta fold hydrolase n=1 Tax=Nocardia sp. NPDC050697 TaxID=3155158 RepID=UPI00340F509C